MEAEGAPGWSLWVVWSGNAPASVALAAESGRWLVGRDTAGIEDSRVSRRHCEVVRGEEGWTITDLGSANGTFVDGVRVDGSRVRPHWDVLQVGRTLVVPIFGAPAVRRPVTEVEGGFVGPGLAPAWDATGEAGSEGAHLLLIGSPGAGVGSLVRHYVRSRGRRDERFSVVPSVSGLSAEAAAELPAGVVFVADLPSQRWSEAPWMVAAVPRQDLRVCVGIERRRRAWGAGIDVAPGFARVEVPPLAARCEEIPWRIAQAVRTTRPEIEVDVTFVEMCLLYDWPGGIGELERACGEAIAAAQQAGSERITARELRAFRGDQDPMATMAGEAARLPFADEPLRARRTAMRGLRDADVLAWILAVAGHDRERAAARLGVPPEALEPWLRRHGFLPDP